MATELAALKMKKRMNKATPEDLTRLKVLQDGEPLSTADLENAKKREEERIVQDKKDYEAKQQAKIDAAATKAAARVGTPIGIGEIHNQRRIMDTDLDVPPEHPRIVALKDALRIFTRIEAHASRPDDFVLFTRDVSITAGDVRRARKAMML